MQITEPMSTQPGILGHSPVVKPSPERSPAALCNITGPAAQKAGAALGQGSQCTQAGRRQHITGRWKGGESKSIYKGFNMERKHWRISDPHIRRSFSGYKHLCLTALFNPWDEGLIFRRAPGVFRKLQDRID